MDQMRRIATKERHSKRIDEVLRAIQRDGEDPMEEIVDLAHEMELTLDRELLQQRLGASLKEKDALF